VTMQIKHKAVIDTNIFLSGLLNESGAPAKLIKYLRRDAFVIILSGDVLDEYTSVIFEFNNDVLIEDAVELFLMIMQKSNFVIPTEKHDVCRDKDDNKFIECAVAASADFIVTKNIRHFPKKEYRGIHIIKIRDFLKILEKDNMSSL